MGKVTESIFDGLGYVIPMADVSHVQRHWYSGDNERTKENYRGLIVVTKHTTWNAAASGYNNSIYIRASAEADDFLACWCRYRAELESETLADLTPPTGLGQLTPTLVTPRTNHEERK